jgi:hypothetical protein
MLAPRSDYMLQVCGGLVIEVIIIDRPLEK